jgi:uncharacterized protein (TIGR00255 family)
MALRSMTGFGVAEGETPEGGAWRWELRGVNGRGLDLRFRLPDGTDALEPAWRRLAQSRLRRGSVTAVLRLQSPAGDAAATLDPQALRDAIAMIRTAEAAAASTGMALAPVTADALLRMPGVVDSRPTATLADADTAARDATLTGGLEAALEAMNQTRAAEGAALGATLATILDTIEARYADAALAHAAQTRAAPDRLGTRLAALVEAGAPVERDRLAHELALLAIKLDVREELDRLEAHIASARTLLASDAPAGRQLDFLTQEFNREVNTLCSKSDSAALTEAGLALKVLVDQLREQAQNVE